MLGVLFTLVNPVLYTRVAYLVPTSTSLAEFFTRGYSSFGYHCWEEFMSDKLETTPESECTVCYAAHDEEIHQATLSIRRWFHHQVTHDFEDETLYLPEFQVRVAAV